MTKNKGGRPTKYKGTETCRQAVIACRLGATDEDLAVLFDVDVSTISKWKNDFPEFSEALKSKNDHDEGVERSLRERAMGYSHPAEKISFDKDGNELRAAYIEHYPPDTTACIFWLKNRQPKKWRDRQEVTGADGTPLIPVLNIGKPGK